MNTDFNWVKASLTLKIKKLRLLQFLILSIFFTLPKVLELDNFLIFLFIANFLINLLLLLLLVFSTLLFLI